MPSSPTSFDNIIVLAIIDKKEYWLSPTIDILKTEQPYLDILPIVLSPTISFFNIEQSYSNVLPIIGKALVLKKNNKSLTNIPFNKNPLVRAEIETIDHFQLYDGFKEASWQRQIRYTGQEAYKKRRKIAKKGSKKILKNLISKDFYRPKNIKARKEPWIEDNNKTLIIKEDNTISNIGKKRRNRKQLYFTYRPFYIKEILNRIKNPETRNSPFALTFPLKRKSILHLDAPEFNFETYENTIKSDFHNYRQKGEYIGKIFQITYEYETLKDHVPISNLKKFNEEINFIRDEIYINLIHSENPITPYSVFQPSIEHYIPASREEKEDIRYAVNDFMNSEIETGKESRMVTAEILSMKGMTPTAKRGILQLFTKLYERADFLEESLYYFKLLNKEYRRPNGNIFIDQARIYDLLGEHQKAADLTRQAVDLKLTSPKMRNAKKWHVFLKNYLWKARNIKTLIPVLEYLVKNYKPKEAYYRELGVAYDLLKMNKKANALRSQMKKHGFKDATFRKLKEGSKLKRNPRPLLRYPPRYPTEATSKNIEGYVIISTTVEADGSVSDCKIVESTHKIFETPACKTVLNYQYYPVAQNEPKGKVSGITMKITFKMAPKRPAR